MSTTSQNSASSRISALLDDNSFVEIGGSVTARNTDFNLQNKETPADGVNWFKRITNIILEQKNTDNINSINIYTTWSYLHNRVCKT